MRSSRNRASTNQWSSTRTRNIYILDGFFSDFSDIKSNVVSSMKAAAMRYDAKLPKYTGERFINNLYFVNRINGKWVMLTADTRKLVADEYYSR